MYLWVNFLQKKVLNYFYLPSICRCGIGLSVGIVNMYKKDLLVDVVRDDIININITEELFKPLESKLGFCII